MFGVSPFHPSWQSNISILSKERFKYTFPWENKISHMASVFLQFPIIPINSKDSFLQTFNDWEFLGILKNSHWYFHLFLSIPKYSKVFYVSSFVCLGINWNSQEFPKLWELIHFASCPANPPPPHHHHWLYIDRCIRPALFLFTQWQGSSARL